MRRIWLSRRAIALHVVIIVVIPTFVVLCLWQLHRALSGNNLSWAYVFEWPFFAGYAIYMWWRFVHEAVPEEGASTASLASSAPPLEEGDEAELAAYNKYLAELAARDKPKQWR